MKHGHGFEIDFTNQKIILTKTFAAKAGSDTDSFEYRELMKVRGNFPDYQIELREIKKKVGKQTYARLTYDNMKLYLDTVFGENSAESRALAAIIKASESQRGRYAYVKRWFLENFPDYDKPIAA